MPSIHLTPDSATLVSETSLLKLIEFQLDGGVLWIDDLFETQDVLITVDTLHDLFARFLRTDPSINLDPLFGVERFVLFKEMGDLV